jgi:hypothetical protein
VGKQPHHRRTGKSASRGQRPKRGDGGGSASGLRVRKVAGGEAWELVHPRCARDRALDLEEVRKMLDAGELDVAMDECRWLLQGCSDCLDAHRILGEIALELNDLPLARGHFGYAYYMGLKAINAAGNPAPLPYALAANQGFFESGKGLIWCLKQLHKPEMASEVIEQLVRCDPSDPLGITKLADNDPDATETAS